MKMKLGERRKVCISVRSMGKESFEVTSAKYTLRIGGVIEASGECSIEMRSGQETILSAVVQPQAKNAAYILEYEYVIHPEILKYEVGIQTE